MTRVSDPTDWAIILTAAGYFFGKVKFGYDEPVLNPAFEVKFAQSTRGTIGRNLLPVMLLTDFCDFEILRPVAFVRLSSMSEEDQKDWMKHAEQQMEEMRIQGLKEKTGIVAAATLPKGRA